MSKQGELEPLKFPSFRRELLYQNHWSPGDDIGRIKIIISEGFPRDSPSNPIERVKNIVTFSFQHAPLSELNLSYVQLESKRWPGLTSVFIKTFSKRMELLGPTSRCGVVHKTILPCRCHPITLKMGPIPTYIHHGVSLTDAEVLAARV